MSGKPNSGSTDAAAEGVEHLPNLLEQCAALLALSPRDQAKLHRQGQLGVQFSDRSLSVRNELHETSRGMPCLAFSDIRWYRYRCASHLRYEAKTLLFRERTREFIHRACQQHRFLPDDQIPITFWFFCRHWFHRIPLEQREGFKRCVQTSRGSDEWLVISDEREAHCTTSADLSSLSVGPAINSSLVTRYSSLFPHDSPSQH